MVWFVDSLAFSVVASLEDEVKFIHGRRVRDLMVAVVVVVLLLVGICSAGRKNQTLELGWKSSSSRRVFEQQTNVLVGSNSPQPNSSSNLLGEGSHEQIKKINKK